jgi:hypothetical protein
MTEPLGARVITVVQLQYAFAVCLYAKHMNTVYKPVTADVDSEPTSNIGPTITGSALHARGAAQTERHLIRRLREVYVVTYLMRDRNIWDVDCFIFYDRKVC